MRWYRRQIRQGALLALFALAINLVLSFGHVHAIGGGHSDDGQLALSAAAPSSDHGQNQGDDHGHPDDLCPICMAVAAIHAGVASTPPALPVAFATTSIHHSSALQVALVEPRRAAFSSRGPPVS